MTLLTTVNNAAQLLGLRQFQSVASNPAPQAQLLFALANEVGQDLVENYEWQALTRQHTFQTTATTVQVGAIPEDWNCFINGSMFNRTQMRQILGPIDPQQWQALLAVPATLLPWLAFRLRDGEFLLTPTAPSGNEIAYEYISTYWAQTDADDRIPQYANDSDSALLNEKLIAMGIRWRYLERNGLDYAEPYRLFEKRAEQLAGGDKGAPVIDAGGYGGTGFNYPNIPLGNWPNGA